MERLLERLGVTFLVCILGPWLCFRAGFEMISSIAPGSLNLLLPSLAILAFVVPLMLCRLAETARRFSLLSLRQNSPDIA